MKAKEFVEQHPLPVYLGVFISAVTAATTLTIHFKDAERDSAVANARAGTAEQSLADQTRIRQLEASLSGIPRAVGSTVRYLPVAKMMITPDQATRLPQNDVYFEGGSFYTMHSTPSWPHSRTTELNLLADLTGQAPDELVRTLTKQARRTLTQWPVEMWRKRSVKTVGNIPGVERLYSEVLVQEVPVRDFENLLAPGGSVDPKAFAAIVLGQQLLAAARQLADQRTRTSLYTVEEKDNVVYARLGSVLDGAIVDGTRRAHYYLTQEIIVVATPANLYLIKTSIPHVDPREGADSVWITRWLANFKIVTT